MERMIGSSAITMARAAAPSKCVSSFLGRQANKVAVGGRRATGRSNRVKVNCMQVTTTQSLHACNSSLFFMRRSIVSNQCKYPS